jgi:hypothetical protein
MTPSRCVSDEGVFILGNHQHVKLRISMRLAWTRIASTSFTLMEPSVTHHERRPMNQTDQAIVGVCLTLEYYRTFVRKQSIFAAEGYGSNMIEKADNGVLDSSMGSLFG